MNAILDLVMNAAGGGAVNQVGRQFGLSPDQTSSALGQLVPALMSGLQRNTSRQGGMESLLDALQRGNHARYLEQPEALTEGSTAEEGNAILGHIFGGKEVSRAVAGRASEQTGIGADVLKKMLPVVATMVMAGLSKQTKSSSAAPATGAGGLISSLLDQNRDGSIADDVQGMLGKFFGGR